MADADSSSEETKTPQLDASPVQEADAAAPEVPLPMEQAEIVRSLEEEFVKSKDGDYVCKVPSEAL